MRTEAHDSESSETPTLQRCTSLAPALVWHNFQFQNGHISEIDQVIFRFPHCVRFAEIPLLPHNLSERTPRIGRGAQNKLLRARAFGFFEDQPNPFYFQWPIKKQSNDLRTGLCSAPSTNTAGQKGGLDRMVLGFRCNLDRAETIQIEPGRFCSRSGLANRSE